MWTCPAQGACPLGVCGYAPQWEVDISHSGNKQALDLIEINDTQKSIENNIIIDIFNTGI